MRALKALRSVLNGLTTKRYVFEPPRNAGTAISDLKALSQAIADERELFKIKVHEAFAPLKELFMRHSEAFLSCAPGWEVHGPFAKAAVKALNELLYLAPLSEELHEGTGPMLERMHATCTAVMAGPPTAAGLDAAARGVWSDQGGRVYEQVCRTVIAYLDNYPIAFASYVPYFLQLFVDSALIALDAATVRSLRAKRRVLVVRFIAKALLNPFYRPEWVEAPIPAGASPQQREELRQSRSRASQAHQALERMLSAAGGQCALLTEAVVAKYIALTQEELEEWQSDPEGYARSMDVESGPDADTPRPIGVGLLLCMLERGGEPVAQALIGMGARLQSQPATQESVLLREACYRCIGEGYTHVSSHINFQSWYENELAPQLQARLPEFLAGTQDLISSVLQARALWLVGVCGVDLPHLQWCHAYKLVLQHMASKDLVVALTAVSSAMALTALILEDQALIEQYTQATKPRGNIPNMVEALQLQEAAQSLQEQEDAGVIEVTRARVAQRLSALSDTMSQALPGAFMLLARLCEVESMVRVLQLVSVLVEVMGDLIRPHLGIIAAALPQIWAAATQHSATAGAQAGTSGQAFAAAAGDGAGGRGDTGAVVRLHSALIAVLTHLVGKLRGVALQDSQITGVIYPLLQYSTNLGSPESECLVEEAFRLWNTTVSSMSQVPQAMLDLLPNLAAILRRGKDNSAVFPILESYLLLNAAGSLQPFGPMIQSSLEATVGTVNKAVLASLAGPSAPAFSPEQAADAMAASALTDVMLQLFPTDVPQLLSSTFHAMSSLVSHPGLPATGVNVKVVNVLEGFLEVLGRLLLLSPATYPALTSTGPGGEPDAGAADRFLDKWLVVASARFIEEIVGVKTMAMLGRFRRRIATLALCALIASDATPCVYEARKLARICSLAIQAVLDDADFHTDQADLDALDFKSDLCEDYVLVKRVGLTRNDPVRSVKIVDTVHAMLHKAAAAVGGEEALVAMTSQYGSPRLAERVADMMHGRLGRVLDDDEDEDELLMAAGMRDDSDD